MCQLGAVALALGLGGSPAMAGDWGTGLFGLFGHHLHGHEPADGPITTTPPARHLVVTTYATPAYVVDYLAPAQIYDAPYERYVGMGSVVSRHTRHGPPR
ncbi:MAG: hypothetical protein ACTSUY_04065 [Alphaproteobacteria bacterium]